ncbi:MAG: NUDIX domain-containing protein [Caldilineaceae bacterium]|nr:NUDIX domain-containing protein [Caldilineaceae bacterium]
MAPTHIRVIAIGIFTRGTELLVFQGYDKVKGSFYYRPLGGGVEPGERAADALRREIREELGEEITEIRLLDVVENLFTVDGRAGHEIAFVYHARFVDPAVYTQETLIAHEDNGDRLTVIWRGLDSFDAQHRLVPPELFEVVGGGVLGS